MSYLNDLFSLEGKVVVAIGAGGVLAGAMAAESRPTAAPDGEIDRWMYERPASRTRNSASARSRRYACSVGPRPNSSIPSRLQAR